MSSAAFTETDLEQLRGRGIAAEEAERQLRLLQHPPGFLDLVRPCTVGDGIERIPDAELPELHAIHEAAQRAGRFTKFVPASGAATRMFKNLLYFLDGEGREASWEDVRRQAEQEDGPARSVTVLLRELQRFPFLADLRDAMAARGQDLDAAAAAGEFRPLLEALLGAEGLHYAALPKGLLKFHWYAAGPRTPFEEHLVEAAHYARRIDGGCRLHFTVSPEHRAGFERLLREVEPRYRSEHGAEFEVGYSEQHPSTDTLATDLHDRPLRDPEGRLVLRPGGHGALIANLGAIDADLVFVKNIDNVQPDRLREPTYRWKRTLGGYLARLQHRLHDYLERLRAPSPPDTLVAEALELAASTLHARPAAKQGDVDFLLEQFDRPLRVCGVVPNTGEPGGGPMWVRSRDGCISLQIVEGAQVDPDSEEQQAVLGGSTHFNPVDLVCGLRGPDGCPYDLQRFIDSEAVIVTRKSAGGRELKALERPGLWNGAMARWNTVFVEVPIETFSPVKTVLDLLRPEHQPG